MIKPTFGTAGSSCTHLAVAHNHPELGSMLNKYQGLTGLQLTTDKKMLPQTVPELHRHPGIRTLSMEAPTPQSKHRLYGLEGLTIWLHSSSDLDWSKFAQLKQLQLGSECSELAEMDCLSMLPCLEALRLFCCPSEDCLRALPRLTRLQFIAEAADQGDLDDSLRSLHYLTSLKDLHIEGQLSNSQVAGLGRKSSLTSLEIHTSETPKCGPKAMAALCRLTKLERLYCSFLQTSVYEARLGDYMSDSGAEWYVYVPGFPTKIAVNKAVVNRIDHKRLAKDFVTGLAV